MGWMKDETGLGKNAANFVPMTPLSHLRRAAHVFPETEAVIYGKQRYTYRDYYGRCSRLASALVKMGVEP
ncbi:MAG: AMP-binding protein, partial [Pseudomonadota bacterium]